MLQIFAITFPFFALVAAGYLAARRGMLPLEAIPGLNGFVLYFALPCMLFRFGATTPLAQLLDGSVVVVWGVVALLLVGAVVGFSRNSRYSSVGWNDAAFGALVAAFSNTGFMGVPLLLALIGPQSAGPTLITIIFDIVVTSSLCIALSRLGGADEHGASKAARQALAGVVVNPMPWAIALGTLASAAQWKPPGPVWQTVSMLADAASPTALFTIGAVLARSALRARAARGKEAVGTGASADAGAGAGVWADSVESSVPHPPRVADMLPIVAVKLIAHPLLVWLAGRAAIAAGLPLAPSALAVLVLVAALPSASNVAILAERFGADNTRIARIILWTTVLSFFSFPLAVAWMK